MALSGVRWHHRDVQTVPSTSGRCHLGSAISLVGSGAVDLRVKGEPQVQSHDFVDPPRRHDATGFSRLVDQPTCTNGTATARRPPDHLQRGGSAHRHRQRRQRGGRCAARWASPSCGSTLRKRSNLLTQRTSVDKSSLTRWPTSANVCGCLSTRRQCCRRETEHANIRSTLTVCCGQLTNS